MMIFVLFKCCVSPPAASRSLPWPLQPVSARPQEPQGFENLLLGWGRGRGRERAVVCVKHCYKYRNITWSYIYSKTLGSPWGWGWAGGEEWWGRGQGRCWGENEGGWSIPEAAGARSHLLGCAGPTRSSFVRGSNPSYR